MTMSGKFKVVTSEAIFEGAEQHVSEKYPNMETMWRSGIDDFVKGAQWALSKADKHLTELHENIAGLEEQLDNIENKPTGRKKKYGK